MQKSRELQFLPQVVLYLVNVYEPCTEEHVFSILSGKDGPKGIQGAVSPSLLKEVLQRHISTKLIIKADDGAFCLTEAGLERLAKLKVAFPRDKFRLYFLKDALKMRGR
jgi:hypothetical protein